MFYKQFLKLLSSAKHNHTCFRFLHTSYLTNQCRVLPLTEITTIKPELYYYNYLSRNLDSYTCIRDIEQLKMEVIKNPHTFKSLNDFFNNLEGDVSQQLKDLTLEFSNCDTNEICKRIIFINELTHNTSKNKNILELIACLNMELWKKKYSKEEIIKILLLIQSSCFNHKFYFSKKAVLKLFKKINSLSSQQIVQFFFGLPRKKAYKLDYKYLVFSCLTNNISKFNVDELGIICQGMLRHNLIFEKNLPIGILTKLLEEIKNIQSIPLQSICLAFEKLNKYYCGSNISEFQEKLIPHVSELDLTDLIGLVSLGVSINLVNYSFWDIVAEKIRENMNNLTLDSILRVINCIFSFNIDDKELLMLSLQEFEKCENIEKYYIIVTEFLSKLVHFRLYSKKLFEVILSENFFFEKVFPTSRCSFKLLFLWWTLYCNLEIEKPEFLTSAFLDAKTRKKIYFIIQGLLETEHKGYFNKTGIDKLRITKRVLKNIYGKEAVAEFTCLPHYESGIVLKFNKNLKVQPIPEEFFSYKYSNIRKPVDDDYWIFITVLNGVQYVQDSNEILPHRQTQYRQLQALGYIPILIKKDDFRTHLEETSADEFLTDLIKKSLEEKK